MKSLTGWTADQLIFIDESAANGRTGDRKYGWSPQGLTCEYCYSIKRSEKWSILPALVDDSYLDWITFQGSITPMVPKHVKIMY